MQFLRSARSISDQDLPVLRFISAKLMNFSESQKFALVRFIEPNDAE